DREADDRVALADRVERAAQLLDVDGDRKRLDAALDRRPVADPRDLALRAKLARTALARAAAKRDCELSDFHDVLQSTLYPGRLAEQTADRIPVVDALDRLAEQATDALDPDLGARRTDLGERDGVGDHDVLQRRVVDPLHRLAAEHRVARARADARRPGVDD